MSDYVGDVLGLGQGAAGGVDDQGYCGGGQEPAAVEALGDLVGAA